MYFVNSQGQRERIDTQVYDNQRDESENDAMSNEQDNSECPFLARECMGLKVSDILLILLIIILCVAGVRYFGGSSDKTSLPSRSSSSAPETGYGFRFY
jgi:hypothetical protein